MGKMIFAFFLRQFLPQGAYRAKTAPKETETGKRLSA
jgi:hypothetical protein